MTRSLASGCVSPQRCERPQRELEAVLLRLVASEEERRGTGERRLGGREVRRVDGVVEDLPGAARLPEELVGGALRELALVQDVLGGVTARRSGSFSASVSSPAQPG